MFGPKTAKTRDEQAGQRSLAKIDELEKTISKEASANSPGVMAKSEVLNLIGKGTIIEGNITAEGDLAIEGRVKGDVSTKTTLVLGPTAVVEGNIVAHHAEIGGQVTGSVRALGLLVIKASCTIMGDVITRNLNVEAGSTFNGRFQVGGADKAVPGPKNTEAAATK